MKQQLAVDIYNETSLEELDTQYFEFSSEAREDAIEYIANAGNLGRSKIAQLRRYGHCNKYGKLYTLCMIDEDGEHERFGDWMPKQPRL